MPLHASTLRALLTGMLLAASASSLAMASQFTSGDGSMSINVDTSHSSGGGGGGGGSGGSSGVSDFHPGAYSSGPNAWGNQAPSAPSDPIVVTDDTANKQSMEARAQAYLGHQHYQRGYDLDRAGDHAAAAKAFKESLEHDENAKRLGAGDKLDARMAATRFAIACALTQQASAMLDAGLYANAKDARVALEEALSNAADLGDAQQSLARARGAEAEAAARADLRANRWPEAVAGFRKAMASYQDAVGRAEANDKQTKNDPKKALMYTAAAARVDLLRARQSTATALNGVAIGLEKKDVHEAYVAAKEAAELWPEQPQLRENERRLGGMIVAVPTQGGAAVDLHQ